MFRYAHAMHTNWKEAVTSVLSQLESQRQLEKFASDPTRSQYLGIVYITEPFVEASQDILAMLKQGLGFSDWVGGVAPGVCGADEEYYREPALVVMLTEFPANSVRLFSGAKPLPKTDTVTAAGRSALASALIHIDPQADQVADFLEDLTIKMPNKQIFGGLMSDVPFNQIANALYGGGLSGAVFSDRISIKTRMTLGVQVVGQHHQVTAARGGMVDTLDDKSALDVFLSDLGLFSNDSYGAELTKIIQEYGQRFSNGLYAGVLTTKEQAQDEQVTTDACSTTSKPLQIKPILGIDPSLGSIAIAGHYEAGDEMIFCLRDEDSARLDLIRMCASLRDEIDAASVEQNTVSSPLRVFNGLKSKPRGGVYISCRARGAGLFSQPGVELRMVREQLGDIPLIGYFANGEVFQGRLYGYTGVLLLFF